MDDFLSKKCESGPVLDLSKATIANKEEFRKLFDRVPDFKVKPEKIRPDDVKITDSVRKMKFKTGKKDYKAMREPYAYNDPIPVEMKDLKITELASVPIDWKMLTSVRPKSKLDEEFFSRIIELRKNELKTEAKDKRSLAIDPQIRKTKNRAGVVEMRAINCSECQVDFCTGFACKQLTYDCFARVPQVPTKLVAKSMSLNIGGEKKKRKKTKQKGRKSRSTDRKPIRRSKSKSKKRAKSHSPRKAAK